jgi:hypothetical protein
MKAKPKLEPSMPEEQIRAAVESGLPEFIPREADRTGATAK